MPLCSNAAIKSVFAVMAAKRDTSGRRGPWDVSTAGKVAGSRQPVAARRRRPWRARRTKLGLRAVCCRTRPRTYSQAPPESRHWRSCDFLVSLRGRQLRVHNLARYGHGHNHGTTKRCAQYSRDRCVAKRSRIEEIGSQEVTQKPPTVRCDIYRKVCI